VSDTEARSQTTVLTVVGTGLIGGSLGLACRKRGLVDRVVGFDIRTDRLNRALERGAIDEAAPTALDSVRGANVVVIATPVRSIPSVFAEVARGLDPLTIVTDVGSTKVGVVGEIERVAPPHVRFIGGHPLAGGEQEGIEEADPELFSGSLWILTPTKRTDPDSYRRLVQFLGGLHTRVLSLEAHRHDELMALVSHLPQLLSSVLMGFAIDAVAKEAGLPLITAGGFRDMTRVAASSPDLWVDIVRENNEALAEVLGRFGTELGRVRRLIETRDWEGLRDVLVAAQKARRQLPPKPGLEPSQLVELMVPVPDRPGVLAEIATTVGEAGINIEDIDIIHSAGGGRGMLRLSVSGEAVARRATEAIEAKGFPVSWAGSSSD
jgi:prephenate dehydrogenase